MNRLLFVEDDLNIAEQTKSLFEGAGWSVVLCRTLAQARQAGVATFDAVVLDWSLPDGEGLELMKEWRREGVTTPIVFLTARSDVVDKVTALECGSNDYVTKPFHFRELLARVKVHTRGHAGTTETAPTLLVAGAITLDLSRCEVTFRGQPVPFTKMELNLLRFFLENPNRVFAREEILDRVWGANSYGTNRTVDTHILQLRKKLEPALFETVWGFGYRFRPGETDK